MLTHRCQSLRIVQHSTKRTNIGIRSFEGSLSTRINPYLFGAREPSREFRSTGIPFFDNFLVTVSATEYFNTSCII